MTEMHDVVEMLLNRIKDYPEDFVDAPSNNVKLYGDTSSWTKWKEALNTVYQVATDEEKLALDEATTDAKRAIYMGAALKTIMSEEVQEEKSDVMAMRSSGRYAVQGLARPTITLPANSMTDKYIALLEQRQKAAQCDMAATLAPSGFTDVAEHYKKEYYNAINNT